MKRPPFARRIVADIVFRERVDGVEDFIDAVQWQMPTAVMRLFQAEARRRGTDINSLIRDFLCEFLTERAEAIRRMGAELDAHSPDR